QFSDIIAESLFGQGLDVVLTKTQHALMRMLDRCAADAIVLGPSAITPGHSFEVAQQIRDFAGSIPLILVVPDSSEDLAIAALKAGMSEYVKYPFCPGELAIAVRHCLNLQQSQANGSLSDGGLGVIIGDSPVMQEIRGRIMRVACSDSNVLITGETGTGKELLAQVLRDRSSRRNQPFIAINCAAIPDSLLESELFGYAKGAFTGADASHGGKLQAADKGTVFLDEIGDMSAYGQAKILRMVESKEVQRLGSNRGIPIDVRIIAATNQDLEQLARENKFRRDLYFRLNVARVHLPPLRERKEDLPALIEHYIRHFNQRFGQKVRYLSAEALNCFLCYDWPGNVRELKNLLESIFVEGPSQNVSVAELPPQFCRQMMEMKSVSGNERERLLWALSATNWNKSKAADKLSWSRMTLYRKMARYNIVPSVQLATAIETERS
ncbi:MAG TPA: sigma-54 dependent transcriptional regulator, partial [Candidatus Angelobacter sp.]|nr:sigma-54 dependent transcriptional regulator [Candidatus Angelobacter sp.]